MGDIEGSELEVLERLSDQDFGLIGSLHVEYHFNRGCGNIDAPRWQRVLQRVRSHLAVVDAAAAYYGGDEPCMLDGTVLPKLIVVSYRARDGSGCGDSQHAA